jgi:hypothetical protein
MRKMQANITESEPTGTTVLLTNPDRAFMRAKAADLSHRLGIPPMSLSAYMRWAALNVNVSQVTIRGVEVERVMEAA